ncbi:hypothetical protein, partial [Sedimenticola sp.]|uniref:hypothetical protein n=1 Tax=Sedimenticola sp. TaxID=1940285 RepID=UPI003D0B9620
ARFSDEWGWHSSLKPLPRMLFSELRDDNWNVGKGAGNPSARSFSVKTPGLSASSKNVRNGWWQTNANSSPQGQ